MFSRSLRLRDFGGGRDDADWAEIVLELADCDGDGTGSSTFSDGPALVEGWPSDDGLINILNTI